jgi:predicted PurR-regulated permease PerM
MTQDKQVVHRTSRRGILAQEPLLMMGVVILTLYFARQILIPLALALTLNFLLAPAVIGLQRLRLRRVPAVGIVVLLAALIVGGVGWIVATQLIGVADGLADYRINIHNKIEALHAPTSGPLAKAVEGLQAIGQELTAIPGETPPPVPPAASSRRRIAGQGKTSANTTNLENPMPVTLVEPAKSTLRSLREVLVPIAKPLGEGVVVLIFTVYMLVKREDLRNRLLLLAGMGRLNLMTQALNDAAQRISSYLVMNFLVNGCYGLSVGVGLFFIGLPNATLWGVLAGILRIVPYLGTMIGAILPLVFSLAVFNTWWQPLLVLLLLGVIEFSLSNFVEPWLYGAHTGISSLALLTTAILWTLLWGWPGLVLSTPLTVCLIVLGRFVPQMSFLHILLGDEAELAPEAKFYERLLAMDQAEAHLIADRFLEGKELIELYDGVVLPALALAEQDRYKGALDEVRGAFLLQSAAELVAEMTDYQAHPAEESVTEASKPIAPRVSTFPVVCVSTKEQADEIAATMLAQLLEHAGCRSLMLPSNALSQEILTRLGEEENTVICISALPPFAFTQSRALCHRVRESLPQNRIMICLWGSAVDPGRSKERFGTTRPDSVTTSLNSAVEQIRDWQRIQPEVESVGSRKLGTA